MNIGIVGSGKIGGVVGKLWARAGHKVLFSSRHPERLDALVREAGQNASRGTVEDALAFGDVILLSIPYGSVEQFGRDHRDRFQGKVVIETGNPYPERDGKIAEEVRASGQGTGLWSARWLPGARLVRGFNSVWDRTLAKEAHRPEPRVGVPLASDDPQAMEVAARLVRDAGFDPVLVGPLARAREFDVGTPVYASNMRGPEVRKSLGVA
ncbi:MAG: NADPH-dependent F420 reductase [Candidatus Methylomirabilales bacterium]